MGRLVFFLLALGLFLFLIRVVSKIIPLSGREMTHEEKIKSFEDEIKTVDKKLKMRE